MAGTHLTMADIPIACEIHRWRGTPLPHQPRPHLDRWYQHMLALPASRGVLDIVLS
jgi:glutathione S-transferase